ncbi:MAG: tRNA preQ1(34) S-adenosylmethionine ribosyltransferase-isomerase QueA [Alphaproteobacteria bacterium]|nr:tRNA preQ1(34) S-adenosylmethionine ribosyltransferase-isomerase QueA [Alphaproteobacteria bacterium]MBU0796626.1 tRNA preQ1(34) S-adenosylmethionine ribosyltransferase-isomerase QueA [Alphaproteobacteria bacterium]MBU0886513.1 tRNA preQ1(34) S-adenosylmethionine ribosyltransferase-isomerase QueA [Alphaproteobacteria bacterium]MBU1814101.1 tRNA preQ1(34) S-adenosylmethionine ribosyltransferase-isomerase QueA [Alphaproteobacteria bacterium]
MKVDLFDFELPVELIAQTALEPRDSARLLDIRPEALADRGVLDLPDLLHPGDLLVFNDTRVIPARLNGHRGEVAVEVLLHKAEADGTWLAFARPGKRLKIGQTIAFAENFAAEILEKREGGEIRLAFTGTAATLLDALKRHGSMPLPPYIRGGKAEPADAERYQTIYAREEGAVAAPTAGLHFTERLMACLAERGIGTEFVTLHVGAGTFLPVKVDNTADHRMHAEWGSIDAGTAARITATKAKGGRVVAVGTTSLRLLESAAAEDGSVPAFAGDTSIFITPGYRFKAVDLLFTNFHLPRSTLFMLVSAFAGLERMQSAYAHAKSARYRFYSYGDACLLHPSR